MEVAIIVGLNNYKEAEKFMTDSGFKLSDMIDFPKKQENNILCRSPYTQEVIYCHPESHIVNKYCDKPMEFEKIKNR